MYTCSKNAFQLQTQTRGRLFPPWFLERRPCLPLPGCLFFKTEDLFKQDTHSGEQDPSDTHASLNAQESICPSVMPQWVARNRARLSQACHLSEVASLAVTFPIQLAFLLPPTCAQCLCKPGGSHDVSALLALFNPSYPHSRDLPWPWHTSFSLTLLCNLLNSLFLGMGSWD